MDVSIHNNLFIKLKFKCFKQNKKNICNIQDVYKHQNI